MSIRLDVMVMKIQYRPMCKHRANLMNIKNYTNNSFGCFNTSSALLRGSLLLNILLNTIWSGNTPRFISFSFIGLGFPINAHQRGLSVIVSNILFKKLNETPISRCFATQKECINELFNKPFYLSPSRFKGLIY